MLDALHTRAHCGNRKYAGKCIELMRERYGFKHIFLTPSCTSAMEMGAILADIQPGDEVILPSYTFASTANAVVLRGAKPVFCDINPDTMNIDVNLIEDLITERTKMILPIDYAGIPCDIDKIMEIADKYGLMVMEDAAQSFHSYYKGKPCGADADFTAFSFHESKNVSCGEGGALVINRENLVERAAIIQEKGTDRAKVLEGLQKNYGWVDIGSSFLLSDISAAMLYAQIEKAEEIVNKRSLITEAYRRLFQPYAERGCLRIPRLPEHVKINHHAMFVIFDSSENRSHFLESLNRKDIHPYIGYTPLHSSQYGCRFGHKPEDVPLTEDISRRIVRLPFYADLADEELDYCLEGMGETLKEIYSF